MKIETKKRIGKVVNTVDTIFSIVCLIFAVIIVISFLTAQFQGKTFYLFGRQATVILTESMEPTIQRNGMVITKQVESADEIEVGDIITYKVYDLTGKQIHICHRIYSINNGIVITKGDANKTVDDYELTMANIDGKVVSVQNWLAPIIGRLLDTSKIWFVIPGINFAVTPPRVAALVMCIALIAIIICIKKIFQKRLEDQEKAALQENIDLKTQEAAVKLAEATITGVTKITDAAAHTIADKTADVPKDTSDDIPNNSESEDLTEGSVEIPSENPENSKDENCKEADENPEEDFDRNSKENPDSDDIYDFL